MAGNHIFKTTHSNPMTRYINKILLCRSQWQRGLRRWSAVASLLGLQVGIPLTAWMSAPCECGVLSGRGHCVEPIPRPEESRGVCVCPWVWSDATITSYHYNAYVEETSLRKKETFYFLDSDVITSRYTWWRKVTWLSMINTLPLVSSDFCACLYER